MSEKPEEEFDDSDADELAGESEDVDLDRVTKDLEMTKRRGAPKGGNPAWRRLELLLEQKRIAELTSDFEDYDIGVREPDPRGRGKSRSSPE
jgi:hypothetical protein